MTDAEKSVLVSVVMPAYQAAGTLREAVESVQAQTLPDWELLIVDDGSTDGTLALADALAAGDPRLLALQMGVNSGAAQARNRAIAAARGRYIAFLDADDVWLPEKLERQIGFMQAQGAVLGFTAFWRQTDAGRRLVGVPATVDHAGLLGGNVIGCLTAIYDAQALGKVMMPDLRLRQDYALWLNILRPGRVAHGLDQPLAIHRRTSGSLSASTLRGMVATWRMFRQVEGFGPVRAAWCLLRHVLNRARSRLQGARA